MNPPIKLGILLSGGGSTAKSIVDATKPGGQLHGKVKPVCVIANKECGGVKKLGEQGEGLPTKIIKRAGKSALDFGREIITELNRHGANFISQNGWLPLTPENVVEKFDGRIINQHPGPLNKGQSDFGGKGMYGAFVHAARLLYAKLSGKHLWTEAVAHKVTKDLDEGAVLQKVRIPITNEMLDFDPNNLTDGKFARRVGELQARVLPYEHQVQIDVLEDIAIASSEDGKPQRDLTEALPWASDNAGVNQSKSTVTSLSL